MVEQLISREPYSANEAPAEKSEAPKATPLIQGIDMSGWLQFGGRKDSDSSLPPGFNHIEISTVDKVADKDGFITKEALLKAAKDPTLDEIEKDDVQHMLKNFELLADKFDDKDEGKKGISREDIAKYNFPGEINFIETSTIDKLAKAKDGSITKEAIEKGLKRDDLTDVERDDMEYLKRQYNNIKGLAGGRATEGISQADIKEFNRRAEEYKSPDERH